MTSSQFVKAVTSKSEEEWFSELSHCGCCLRHATDRPTKIEQLGDSGKIPDQAEHRCSCTCRHYLRMFLHAKFDDWDMSAMLDCLDRESRGEVDPSIDAVKCEVDCGLCDRIPRQAD